MSAKVRALIVDDDDDVLQLARQVIKLAGGIEIVGEASGGVEALDKWRVLRPDVVVLDQRMPDISGRDVARTMLGEDPAQPIVLFSAYLDELAADPVDDALCTVLTKGRFDKLAEAIRACADA